MKRLILTILIITSCTAIFSGCTVVSRFTSTKTPTQTATPEFTPTPEATLTPTPPPSAAVVNGVYIWLDDYNGKKEQLRAAYQEMGENIPDEPALGQEALDALIDETLFLSAAQHDGIAPTNEEVESRIQALANDMGGMDALKSWQTAQHYTEESFRRALLREMSISVEKEKIFAEKLSSVEQVHVWQITSADRATLQEAKSNLELGFAFPEIAAKYDELTHGDMNWIARGVIFFPELEDAIFALQPGQYSDIIEFDNRFYIFYVAEKSTDHAMNSEVERIVMHNILSEWLKEQRSQATIETLVNG